MNHEAGQMARRNMELDGDTAELEGATRRFKLSDDVVSSSVVASG